MASYWRWFQADPRGEVLELALMRGQRLSDTSLRRRINRRLGLYPTGQGGRILAGRGSRAFGRGDTQRGSEQCGQASKGVWGMSWRQEAKKGVEDCDKPGGMVKRVLIPGSLN